MPSARSRGTRARDPVLPVNHSLFAFTDGLQEARSAAGEVFGNDRLRAAVKSPAGRGASALVNGMLETMEAFTRQAEPHDDLTMLAAARTGAG